MTSSAAAFRRGWRTSAIFVSFICPLSAQTTSSYDAEVPTQAQLKELYDRPLKLPSVKRGGACPVSTPRHDAVPRAGYTFCSGCAWFGNGPVYFVPAWFDETAGSVPLNHQMPREKGRYSVKTAWVTKPDYAGPVLARFQRLEDGEKIELRFDGRGNRDFQVSSPQRREAPTRWSFWPSSLLLPKPGCYGAQIDTAQGSDVVVFAVTKR